MNQHSLDLGEYESFAKRFKPYAFFWGCSKNCCCQEIDVSQIVLGDIVQVHDGTLGSTEKKR